MDEISDLLRAHLNHTMDRIRHLGGGVVFDESPDAGGDGTTPGDEADLSARSEERERSFGARRALIDRANQLAEALERLRRGEYGLCQECGEPIAPVRLRAVPEATACVPCRDRQERGIS
jgi:RNA polymerase-binding transcription factor DksA